MKGARLPTLGQLQKLADDFNLELTDAELVSYQNLMKGVVKSTAVLEAIPEFRPEVKYPRTPGYRPSQEENPYNAWYYRCRIEGAPSGILKGYEVGIKDAHCVAGVPMMNGSRVLEGYIPDIDATIVTKILDAGGTVVGKTSTEDCSVSGGGYTCSHGPIRIPRKPTHPAGGSSGGSAAAVAAGDVKMATGGDQAGSIRLPASRCGIVGLKPTFGLVSYTGSIFNEMTLDHVGPMCDTVENTARLLTAIAGPDPLDPRQRGVIPANWQQDYMSAIDRGVKGMRIGILKEGFGQSAWDDLGFPASDEIVDRKCLETIKDLERLGAEVVEVSVPMHMVGPHLWNGIGIEGPAMFMLQGNSAGSNYFGFYNTSLLDALGKNFDSRARDLPVPIKFMLLAGAYLNKFYHGRYYAKAQNQRHLLTAAYDEIFKSVDIIVMPTIPFVTPPIPGDDISTEEYMKGALDMIGNTCQHCITGHPAITVPCGLADDLPIGLMFVGRHWEDLTVLQVADAVEKSRNWQTR